MSDLAFAWLGALIFGIAINFLYKLFEEKSGKIAEYLLKITAAKLPNLEKTYREEEWIAELEAISDGPISRFLYAFSIFVSFSDILEGIYGEPSHRYFIYRIMTFFIMKTVESKYIITKYIGKSSNKTQSRNLITKTWKGWIMMFNLTHFGIGAMISSFLLFGKEGIRKGGKPPINQKLMKDLTNKQPKRLIKIQADLLTIVMQSIDSKERNDLVDALEKTGSKIPRQPEKLATWLLNLSKKMKQE